MRILHGRGSRQYLLGLLALLAVSSTVWAGVPASPPPSWIHDGANLLKPEELSELTTLREQLEQRTGAQLVVLTLAEAGSESADGPGLDSGLVDFQLHLLGCDCAQAPER